MWPYILLIALPILAQNFRLRGKSLYFIKFNNAKNDLAMKLFWSILLLMLVLRHETIGMDVSNYHHIFTSIANGSWIKALTRSAEVGYSTMNKLISMYTNNFRWVLVISAILGVSFIARAYIRYSVDATLSISLFIITSNFLMLFSGLRQAIAISLGFVAFEYVKERKLTLFILIVAAAMLFHTSAFMLFFMYPLYHARITKSWLFVIIPMLCVLFVNNRLIFGGLTNVLSMFTKYDAEISSTGAYTMLILFICFAFFSYIVPDEKKMDKDVIGMRNLLLFAVALQMFAPLHSLAMRMNYYYIPFIPILIPRIIECRSTRWNQVAIACRHIMIIFFIVYFFKTAPADNVLNTFPFHFCWETFS